MSDTNAPEHLRGLNPEQLDAVTCTEGPLLILAGAGSGKTRVLTRRVAHLLHIGVRPWNILAVTFTNKAAREMAERVHALVGPAGKDVRLGTFHSTCSFFLRHEIERLGYTRGFVIYDQDDQLRVAKDVIKELKVDPDKFTPKALLGVFDRAKNRLTLPHNLPGEEVTPVAQKALRAYERRLREANAVDFNDIINLSLRILREHPDVLERWRARWRYLLVDEYQDTNLAQYHLIRLLAGGRRNLAVVGDDDQSIYAFRGADIRNILDFEEDFPDARVIRLEQNYRSTGSVLKAATAVVRNNLRRKVKELWTSEGDGEPLHLITAPDEEQEAARVVEELKGLFVSQYKPADVAIIYRTNARSRPFEQALMHARIPYNLVGARRFYERREVKDMLAWARLVLNPSDGAAFARVVGLRRGIGDKAIEQVTAEAEARGLSVVTAARRVAAQPGRGAKPLKDLLALLDLFIDELPRHSPGPFLQLVAERSGYLDAVRSEGADEAEDRLRNLSELFNAAEVEETITENPTPGERLQLFLDRATLSGQDDDLDNSQGRVTLLTAHLAKGLEFPVVFVAGLCEGSFPMLRERTLEEDVEEERRLLYVAITRARQRLTFTRYLRRMRYGGGGWADVPRSRFHDEIPPELFQAPRGRLGAPATPLARPSTVPSEAQKKLDAFLKQVNPSGGAGGGRRGDTTNAPENDEHSERTLRLPKSVEELRAGQEIHHAELGDGKIVSRVSMGAGLMLIVMFNKAGRKMIDPRRDPLELILRR